MYACIYACMQHVLVMKVDFQFDVHMYVCLRSIYTIILYAFDSVCMSAVVQAFHNEVIYCLSFLSMYTSMHVSKAAAGVGVGSGGLRRQWNARNYKV